MHFIDNLHFYFTCINKRWRKHVSCSLIFYLLIRVSHISYHLIQVTMCSNCHKNRNEHTGCLSHQRPSGICNRQLFPITTITVGLIGLYTPQEVGGDMWGAVKTPCPSSLACLGPLKSQPCLFIYSSQKSKKQDARYWILLQNVLKQVHIVIKILTNSKHEIVMKSIFLQSLRKFMII